MTQITARDCMVKKLVTLRPEMDVMDAVAMLIRNRISGAPVVDASGQYLGVFSEKCSMQVIMDAAYESLPSSEVGLFTDTEAQTISPDTHLLSIAQIFLLTPYRRLPVLDDGVLIGQVSRRDVLKAAHSMLTSRKNRDEGSKLLYLSALVEQHEAPLA